MVTRLRMIFSAMGCLVGATTLSRWTADMSDTMTSLEAFSAPDRLQDFYKEVASFIEDEITNAAGKLIRAQLKKGFLQYDDNNESTSWEMVINETEWVNYFHEGSIGQKRATSLATFLELCQPQHMLEIGSFLGLSSAFFLRVMEPWGGHLTSVDPNVRQKVFDKPRNVFNKVNSPFSDRLHTVDAFWLQNTSADNGRSDYSHYPPVVDSATIEAIYSDRKIVTPKDFIDKGEFFDMAFIDGAHDYENINSDFYHVLNVLKPNSCVMFDRFDEEEWPDNYKAIMDIFENIFESEKGLLFHGEQTALFIDRGLIERQRGF